MDALAAIKQIYYSTSKATIQKDFERAIDLLKSLPSDEQREKAAVYMDGIAQMRAEWKAISGSRPPVSAPPPAAPRARFDPSKASSRRRR